MMHTGLQVSVLKTQKDEMGLKLQQERSAKDKAAAELAETQKQVPDHSARWSCKTSDAWHYLDEAW